MPVTQVVLFALPTSLSWGHRVHANVFVLTMCSAGERLALAQAHQICLRIRKQLKDIVHHDHKNTHNGEWLCLGLGTQYALQNALQ